MAGKKIPRILSLLPAATEIVYLLGLEKYLVGVSHECDYPPEAKKKPKLTFSEISNKLSSREIDHKVKNMIHKGPGIFHIKEEVLKKLWPNLILTQELCEVCAIGFNQVKKAASVLGGEIKIVSLEPESVKDILENILLVGEATGYRLQAQKAVQKLKKRAENCKLKTINLPKPLVLVIEWLDPIMVAGHWIPQMVKLAGGLNLISKAGEKSKRVTLDQIKASNPDILIISPCGFDIKRIIKEKHVVNKIIKRKKDYSKVYLVDGNSYMTRPGPRIVDGVEILSEILHPEIFPRKYSERDWIIFR